MTFLFRNKLLGLFALAILLTLTISDIGFAGKDASSPLYRIFLTNRVEGGFRLSGGCQNADEITVAAKEILSLQCDDPANFKMRVDNYNETPLDPSREGHFSLRLEDNESCFNIQGALETVTGLNPAVKNYYIYVWEIRQCEG